MRTWTCVLPLAVLEAMLLHLYKTQKVLASYTIDSKSLHDIENQPPMQNKITANNIAIYCAHSVKSIDNFIQNNIAERKHNI